MPTTSPHDKRSTTDLDQLIGRRIYLFRKIKEIDLQDLAEKIGISYQQLQKYENGSIKSLSVK